MRRLLLVPLYFVLVTPLGLACRLAADPMRRRWRRHVPSYLILS